MGFGLALAGGEILYDLCEQIGEPLFPFLESFKDG